MIVLDASVVLKWVFSEEQGSERADRLKSDHVDGTNVVAVPDLLFYEIANVLATKTRLSEKDCREALSLLWYFDLERFELGLQEFLGSVSLAKRYKITLYDAVYIELAQRLKCVVITADKRLHERVKSLKIVELL
jgi:predicted nucleic acid-binding protein